MYFSTTFPALLLQLLSGSGSHCLECLVEDPGCGSTIQHPGCLESLVFKLSELGARREAAKLSVARLSLMLISSSPASPVALFQFLSFTLISPSPATT